jgi:hypothetical protein
MEHTIIEQIKSRVAKQHDDILRFFRDIIAIPSMDGQIREVGERIEAEMRKLGFDDVWWDKMGNIVGDRAALSNLLRQPHRHCGIGNPIWECTHFRARWRIVFLSVA